MQFGFTLKPDHTIERTLALDAPGRGRRLRLRLAVRLPRPVARAVPAADADGRRPRRTLRLGHLRHEPGDARAVRDGVDAGGPRRDERRPDGPGHRPRRLRATGPGQAADDDGDARGGDRTSSGRSSRAARSSTRGPMLELPWSGRWTLPVWIAGYGPDGARDDRADRRRGDPPARRPGPRPLVRVPAPRRRRRAGRPRPGTVKVHGRGAGARRRPSPTAATGPAGSRRSYRTTSSTS